MFSDEQVVKWLYFVGKFFTPFLCGGRGGHKLSVGTFLGPCASIQTTECLALNWTCRCSAMLGWLSYTLPALGHLTALEIFFIQQGRKLIFIRIFLFFSEKIH